MKDSIIKFSILKNIGSEASPPLGFWKNFRKYHNRRTNTVFLPIKLQCSLFLVREDLLRTTKNENVFCKVSSFQKQDCT
jgi:hypothetical protein